MRHIERLLMSEAALFAIGMFAQMNPASRWTLLSPAPAL